MNDTASLQRRIAISSSPEPIRALRGLLGSFLRDRSVPEETVRAVVLAFSEALDNAIEHGSSGHGELRLWVRYTPRFVCVSLLDPGSDRVPLALGRPPSSDSERGRGFQLMNKLMDEVRVRSYPSGGTRVSMLRRFDRMR